MLILDAVGTGLCPPPGLLVIRSWVGPARPKGAKSAGVVASCSALQGRWEGFCHRHPGRQLPSPACRELFRGRRVGMWARCQVQQPPSSNGESAELPAWELCYHSCPVQLALPGRPQARLSTQRPPGLQA